MANGERRWTIEWYQAPNGDVPLRRFMASLTPEQHNDAVAVIERLTVLGNRLREPHSRLAKDGLYELRRYQVRIFFVFRPNYRAVLLDGVVKKKDKLDPADVERALRMKRELEGRA